jgi:hypothetical protein
MIIHEGGILIQETLFDKVIFDSWILKERHHKELCNCSYCQKFKEENKDRSFWIPPAWKASNSWWVLAVRRNDGLYYYRFTRPKLSALLGIELGVWGAKGDRKWRLMIGQFGMGKNSVKSLITLTSHNFSQTPISHIESIFWKDLRF